jgi:hypothetical protein
MALTAHERSSAHYHAAKKYMRYGDAQKTKAHIKRALHYGFGTDRVIKLHQDIDQADLTVIKRNLDEVFDVLARLLSETLKCVRLTAVTQDDEDRGKKEAILRIFATADGYKEYPQEVIRDYTNTNARTPASKAIRVSIGPQRNVYIKDPRRLYGIDENSKLVNAAIGPNLVDVEHAISTAAFTFFQNHADTYDLHAKVIRLTSTRDVVLAALNSCLDKSFETMVKGEKDPRWSPDDKNVARLLGSFWNSAMHVFSENESYVTVEPLAHAKPSYKGFSLFQLLIGFSDEGTRKLVAKTVEIHSRLYNVPPSSEAWKNMMRLMLSAAAKVRDMGPFYALKWASAGADQMPTSPGFTWV